MASKVLKLFLPLLLFNGTFLIAQPFTDSTWYWTGGDYMPNQRGIYSYVPYWPYSPTPGARSNCAYWTDNSGRFWLFGGAGYDGAGHSGYLNDLWKYVRPFEWAWVKGDNTVDQPNVYGTKGVSTIANKPSGRFGSVTWTDNDGNLWLFGGKKNPGSGSHDYGYLNDLWKYNIANNEWTWIKGDSTTSKHGVYGTIGVPDDANYPGGRSGAVGWKDPDGNLWLFSGDGLGEIESEWYPGFLNDLWKYNIATNQWTWMKGSAMHGFATGVYGTKGVDAVDNTPGARTGSASWIDNNNNFWLWGGSGVSETPGGLLNDLWKYDISTGNWTWMNGAKRHDRLTNYGTKGMTSDTAMPGGRMEVFHWKDAYGNFWLYGGAGSVPSHPVTAFSDLWKYRPSTNQWTWEKGDSIAGKLPSYDVRGAGIVGYPGARAAGAAWPGPNRQLWLFGGSVYRPISGNNELNDLWVIGISPFVLPVRLVQFSASPLNESVKLQWRTEAEINFDHFNVQRSRDGNTFETLVTIKGDVAVGVYSYTDINALQIYPGKNFYRLQMVDRDETFSYSAVISIDGNPFNSRITIYSNPVKDVMQLVIDSKQAESVSIEIVSMSGALYQRQQTTVQKGQNCIFMNVGLLADGAYVVLIKNGTGTKGLKFIKQ